MKGGDGRASEKIENAVKSGAVKTGNETLDAILTDKSILCEKNGIVLSCIADGSKLSFMSASDLYALFGKAVDNAIEAVLKLENRNERRISLQIKAVGAILCVYAANSYRTEAASKGRRLKAARKTGRRGRYGMKGIMPVVKKHKGTAAVSADNGIFSLNIIFPLAE